MFSESQGEKGKILNKVKLADKPLKRMREEDLKFKAILGSTFKSDTVSKHLSS